MRSLPRLFLPILIALALSPNNLSQGNTQPESKQAVEEKQEGSDHLAPTPTPSLIKQKVPQATPNQNNTERPTPKPRGDSGKPSDSAWWFNVLLIIFTAILAGVGVIQSFILCYTYQIAEVALSRERPFLFSFSGRVKEQPLGSQEPEFRYAIGSVSCDIQNFGNGPAIDIEVVARLRFGTEPYFATPVSFADCYRARVGQKVLPPNDHTNFIVMLGAGIQDTDVSKMYDEKSNKRFSCYGVIRYVYGKTPYETTFGFYREFVRKADEAEPSWQWVNGPDTYNRYT